MSASTYKIWAVGNPVGNGISGSYHVGMASVGKKANANEPNIVINELLCNLIARALCLPCPPGALANNGGENYFCSLNFNLAGQALPPVSPSVLVSKFPELCWGIVLFDIFVMNPDRHANNLSYDQTTGAVQIFDHSRAFLPVKATIDSQIADNTGKLGFTCNCLKNELSSMNGFDFWVERIKLLPSYVIEEAVKEISDIGFPVDKVSLTVDFLKTRRDSIDGLVTSNIAEFPKLPKPTPRPSASAATVIQGPVAGGPAGP